MTKSETNYDVPVLADTLRRRLTAEIEAGAVTEKRMFGGVCFLLHGNMLCAAGKKGFMFRVGVEQQDKAERLPSAEPVFMQKRFMPGFFRADPAKTGPKQLGAWLALAHAYVASLPGKAGRASGTGATPPRRRAGGRR